MTAIEKLYHLAICLNIFNANFFSRLLCLLWTCRIVILLELCFIFCLSFTVDFLKSQQCQNLTKNCQLSWPYIGFVPQRTIGYLAPEIVYVDLDASLNKMTDNICPLKQKTVCACVRVCKRACMRACLFVCICLFLIIRLNLCSRGITVIGKCTWTMHTDSNSALWLTLWSRSIL